MEKFSMNNTFFFINKTEKFFPRLDYHKENIPVGNSITMCIAVSWANKERGKNYDLMKSIKNFPRCKETETGKFIWNSEDPVYGIDVPIWVQHVHDADCYDDAECDRYCDVYYNGEFVNSVRGKKCYSYDVIDNICIVIDFDPVTNNYIFAGGCFKNGEHYMMTPAEQNKVYNFNDIEIEVRNSKDPVIKAGALSFYTYSFGENWVNKHLYN
jgi:hypothetical protein